MQILNGLINGIVQFYLYTEANFDYQISMLVLMEILSIQKSPPSLSKKRTLLVTIKKMQNVIEKQNSYIIQNYNYTYTDIRH